MGLLSFHPVANFILSAESVILIERFVPRGTSLEEIEPGYVGIITLYGR